MAERWALGPAGYSKLLSDPYQRIEVLKLRVDLDNLTDAPLSEASAQVHPRTAPSVRKCGGLERSF